MPDGKPPTSDEREASLFRNGRSQAVRIPREFEFPGDRVVIRKEGERLVIEPAHRKRTLLEVLSTLQPIDEEIEIADDLPPEPVDL